MQAHPRRATAVACHDPATLFAQAIRPVDEAFERRLLRRHHGGRPAEPDLRRVERRARDIDRIVSHRPVGVQVATPLSPAGDVRVRKSGSADVEKRQVGSKSRPGRMQRSRRSNTEWLVVVGDAGRHVVLLAGDWARETPVVDQEGADRARTLNVARAAIAERRGDIGGPPRLTQLARDVVSAVPGLAADGHDVAKLRTRFAAETPHRSR